jgi:hypothetical protein
MLHTSIQFRSIHEVRQVLVIQYEDGGVSQMLHKQLHNLIITLLINQADTLLSSGQEHGTFTF